MPYKSATANGPIKSPRPSSPAEIAADVLSRTDSLGPPSGIGDAVDVSRAARFNAAIKGDLYPWGEDSWRDPVLLLVSMHVRQEREIGQLREQVRALLRIAEIS